MTSRCACLLLSERYGSKELRMRGSPWDCSQPAKKSIKRKKASIVLTWPPCISPSRGGNELAILFPPCRVNVCLYLFVCLFPSSLIFSSFVCVCVCSYVFGQDRSRNSKQLASRHQDHVKGRPFNTMFMALVCAVSSMMTQYRKGSSRRRDTDECTS
jgi:hypothetical protein